MVLAGVAAGGVNAVIGSGGLITFSTLVALGLSPLLANVTSKLGLVPGSASSILGYRRELRGQGRRARTLAAASGAGGLTGSVLLLQLPSTVFDAVVPVLILAACALMLAQPRLSAWVARRRQDDAPDIGIAPLAIGFGAGVYGGYFGAAQGVILLSMLAVFVPDEMRRSNALKNVLAGTANTVAAVVFIFTADIDWLLAGLIAGGAIVGGALGARVGRRIPPNLLRVGVVAVGLGVAVRLVVA